jgi:glyoxylase-like metal-dependent hydrolase (beta-lactamase superfamily II)
MKDSFTNRLKTTVAQSLLLAAISMTAMASQKPSSLEISKIEEGVYLHTSYKDVSGFGKVDSNGMVVVSGIDAYVIDTPWSEVDTQSLLDWIQGQGFTIRASLSTHSHDDRAAGIGLMNHRSIPTFTSALTKQLLLDSGKPIASNTFSDKNFSMLQGQIEVFFPGAGHSNDNLVVWLPEKEILFGGCLVRSLNWKSLGFTGDADIESWADSIKNIKQKYPVISIIVPGHGELGDTKILDHTIGLAEAASREQR